MVTYNLIEFHFLFYQFFSTCQLQKSFSTGIRTQAQHNPYVIHNYLGLYRKESVFAVTLESDVLFANTQLLYQDKLA
jgi:hypothetical protein